MEETEELHRITGSCYKLSITAEKSATRDSSYTNEGFRLQIRFVETEVGGRGKRWRREKGMERDR